MATKEKQTHEQMGPLPTPEETGYTTSVNTVRARLTCRIYTGAVL